MLCYKQCIDSGGLLLQLHWLSQISTTVIYPGLEAPSSQKPLLYSTNVVTQWVKKIQYWLSSICSSFQPKYLVDIGVKNLFMCVNNPTILYSLLNYVCKCSWCIECIQKCWPQPHTHTDVHSSPRPAPTQKSIHFNRMHILYFQYLIYMNIHTEQVNNAYTI